jgi:N-carbamoylputrescine amidase
VSADGSATVYDQLDARSGASTDAGVLRVGLLQHACPPSRSVQGNRDCMAELARDAADRGATLLVTQELFDGPYFPQAEDERRFGLAEDMSDDAFTPGSRLAFLADLARELRVFISGSCFERRTPGLYHNRTVMLGPDGRPVPGGSYRKMHIPDDPRFYEKYYFAPGDGPTAGQDPAEDAGWCVVPIELRGPKSQVPSQAPSMRDQPHHPAELRSSDFDLRTCHIGQLICWDQWYPEAARCTALLGAQVLLYPTAIAWHAPGRESYVSDEEDQRQRDAWITIQRSHAIANGCFVCAVNRTGVEEDLTFWGSSFIAEPGGKILAQAPVDQDAALVADLDLSLIEQNRRAWPFLRDRRIDAYGPLLRRWGR